MIDELVEHGYTFVFSDGNSSQKCGPNSQRTRTANEVIRRSNVNGQSSGDKN